MRLIICLPGNNFSGQWLDSFIPFYNWCIHNKITPILSRRESCNIYYVRNMCLGGDSNAGENQKPWQGRIEYDYILWIDSDNMFKVDDFQDRTDADWYFIYKDYNVVKVESEEQIEDLYWA